MIGHEDFGNAPRCIGNGKAFIAGNRRLIAHQSKGAVVLRMAVAIDHQPRITLVNKRGPKNSGKLAANPQNSNINADVPVQLRLGQAKLPQ